MKPEHRSGENPIDGCASPAGDEELMAAVAARDEAAFRTLYLRYFNRLRQFIVRVTRRPDLAGEVLNDTFFTVWRKAPDFAARSAVSTWIFGIAYRKCLKALERTERWQARYRPMDRDEDPAGGDERPEQAADGARLRRRVRESLEDLSPEQRMVFELTHFFGYSYPEIAAVSRCSVNTVKTRMFHARRKLRASLEGEQ